MPRSIEEGGKRALLLETIRIHNGEALHLHYHHRRFNESRKELFSAWETVDLGQYLSPPDRGLYRCRVLYDREVRKVEYLPYRPRRVKKLSLVEESIDYSYKYADRRAFEKLLSAHPECDDLLIVREGLLTDTTIANIALLKNGRWITPEEPLLRGTTRERLIDEGFLSVEAIQKEKISDFDGFALMNAMIGFKVITSLIITYRGKSLILGL